MRRNSASVPPADMRLRPELRLDWCSHQAARFAVTKWHYSRSMPVPPLVKIGVWEGGKFIGAVLFSRGASPDLLRPYSLTQIEGCELTRVALTEHVAPVTRIVALAIGFLRRKCPGLRLIVSFADPRHGHHGGIYQAGNWIYTGETAPTVEYESAGGRRWHARQIGRSGVNTQFGARRVTPKLKDCIKHEYPGKFRYLMPLDPEIRERVEPLRKPYPRAKQATAGHPPDGGGAAPTRALQIRQEHDHEGPQAEADISQGDRGQPRQASA